MKRSYWIALAIAVASVGWIASGQFSHSGAADIQTAEPAGEQRAERAAVRVLSIQAEPMVNEITVQGTTKAARIVELRSQTAGKVMEVLVEPGVSVKAGDVLVRLDPEDRHLRLDQARMLLRQREMELEAAQRLNQKGFNSELKLAEARANHEVARHAVERAEIELRHMEIKAPFDGVLDTRSVEIGAFVDKGNPVATVVDLDPIKVTGQITEQYVSDVSVGTVGHARLVNGQEVEGEISYVSATTDPATRTFRVEFKAPNPDGGIAQGMTAQLRLPVDRKMAHQLPPSALSLADDGTVGVKLVEAGGVVRFVPVRILGSLGPRIWVDGLPETAAVVVVGQEFVTDGQVVEAVPVQMEDLS